MCYQKNPILQIVYLTLMGVNAFLFFMYLFPLIPNVAVPIYHKVASVLALSLAYISYWKACFANPGIITTENQDQFLASFDYDSALYFPDRKCHTCGTERVPRSKHCAITGKCIARFDHFCGWLNNDVGELNYRWFHLFLVMNYVACFYGAYLYGAVLYGIVEQENLMESVFMTPSGQQIQATPIIIVQYMLSMYLIVIAQWFFLIAIGMMLFGFWGYHMYLTMKNRTTNETFKWDDIGKLHRIVYLYRNNPTKKNPDDMKELYHRIYDDDDEVDQQQQKQQATVNETESNNKKNKKSAQRKSSTSSNNNAPVIKQRAPIPVDKEWRLKQLITVSENVKKGFRSLPNIYDKGILSNIKEMMFPRAASFSSINTKSKFN